MLLRLGGCMCPTYDEHGKLKHCPSQYKPANNVMQIIRCVEQN